MILVPPAGDGRSQNTTMQAYKVAHGASAFHIVYISSFFADKQTFQNIDLIGWYATGAALSDIDMEVHRQIMELNAAPAFLLLDPTPRKGQKELPVSLYESGEYKIIAYAGTH